MMDLIECDCQCDICLQEGKQCDGSGMPRSGKHLNPDDAEWNVRIVKMTNGELEVELENSKEAYDEVVWENTYLCRLQQKIDGIEAVLKERKK